MSFTGGDGVYVALVFAWIDTQDKTFSRETDPVIETVRKNVQGSHWLIKAENSKPLALVEKPMAENDWPSFVRSLGIELNEGYRIESFNEASRFACERIAEMKPGEALLVSVG